MLPFPAKLKTTGYRFQKANKCSGTASPLHLRTEVPSLMLPAKSEDLHPAVGEKCSVGFTVYKKGLLVLATTKS